MQYLSTRYENGKAKVGEFMQKRHCTVQHKNIVLAHGDVVEKQAELGPSTLLAANLLTFSFCFFLLCAFDFKADNSGGRQHFVAPT